MRFAVQKQHNISILIPELLVCKDENQEQQALQSICNIYDLPRQRRNDKFQYSRELQHHLLGKKLLLDEIPFPLSEIQNHYINGCIQYNHGLIITSKKQFKCKRCGNQDQQLFASFHCTRCQEDSCTYCRNCIMMGRVSQCTPLITWTGPTSNISNSNSHLNWTGQLSTGQQTASNKVIEAIQNNKDLLVWAVCGSGKTEVLFQGILTALQQGKQVCITTPRTDVVLELAPRLKKAFPDTTLSSLYGGSEDRGQSAQLTISTTHQLLRFHKNFDVMIIDEVDAFPYSTDESLQYAAQQAKKEKSTTIYLTATPGEALKLHSKKGKIETVTIPARYHRHPLPIPTFQWCGNWKKKLNKNKNIPSNLKTWVTNHLQIKKQAFLFVPQIEILIDIVVILKKIDPNIEGVHSEDPNRKEKVQAFREGTTPILVTTTILERGVTIPNADVAVLGSEDSIFTESALVQIAGRVGRNPNYPTGKVIFYHYGKTKAMIAAKNQILKMNKEGEMLGLID